MIKKICLFSFLIFFGSKAIGQNKGNSPWPEATYKEKPWTRWWWMGSAVDKENIKYNLEKFSQAGLGGVEITPIYGVKGKEDKFIDYLSDKWLEMCHYTIKIADSLGMKVDMVMGTGWPYGGAKVTLPYAATKLHTQHYSLKAGEELDKIIEAENEKLPTELLAVVAFGDNGEYLDLTKRLQGNKLKWKAQKQNYKLYAIFNAKTGQKVKRAAPGGDGFTLDHYSEKAFNVYAKEFDEKLNGSLRAIFNDSYEVYGTDFTPDFLSEFEKRRGYDLKKHFHQLLNETDEEIANRIRSDYRETLSDLLKERFDRPWTNWAHSKGYLTKLQAHGSPGNLLDLYATADIPECETFGSMPFDIKGFRREPEDIRAGDADPVMLKFSSSAAHISGKPLVSSEAFTWLRDHFKTALSQCKPEAEELFLNGVNHLFLHGSTYSPKDAAWPGWKFYASVNFSPQMNIWKDVPSLFSYISNCETVLQEGKADNETLLYWPIYDEWGKFHKGDLFFQFKIHSLNEWLIGTSFYETTQNLLKKGYGVDFISDEFIAKATVENGLIKLPGGKFKALIVPSCEKMPLETFRKLLHLKEQGAQIFFKSFPKSVPGFYDFQHQNIELSKLKSRANATFLTNENLNSALATANVYPEKLVETGLKFIRRNRDDEKAYFLVNHTAEAISGFIPIQTEADEVILMDPLTKEFGKAKIKKEAGRTLVKLNIESGKSLILKTTKESEIEAWKYYEALAKPIELEGNWNVKFLEGGPSLPAEMQIDKLTSWTNFGKAYEDFSGTAVYEIEFDKPNENADTWKLNLGDVRESAKVWVNGNLIGTAWSAPFELNIGDLKPGRNALKIEVTNLSANRIRAKELKGEEWKIFYEINIVNKDYEKFDATKWKAMPSGLISQVTLTPLKHYKE